MDGVRKIRLVGGGALALLLGLIAPFIGTACGECSAFDDSEIDDVWTIDAYPAWAEGQIGWTTLEGTLHAAIELQHAPLQEFLGDANLSRSVAGPTVVIFVWRVDHLPPAQGSFENSTEKDGLFLLVDGRIERGCTAIAWREERVELGVGRHNLTWMLSKDTGGWKASGWIDQICIDCLIMAPDRVMGGVPSYALVADAGAGADAAYNWTVVGGEITSGQGTPSITWAARNAGTALVSVEVTASGIASECAKEVAVYGCSIQAPGWAVPEGKYNASVPDAGADAAYNWTVVGGEITSGQGTPSITWTACDAGMARISVDVAAYGIDADCAKEIVVYECSIQALDWVVSGGDYNASVADAGAGSTYTWTVSGGSILSGQGTRSIEWRAGRGGSAIIGLVVSADGFKAECEKEVEVYRCGISSPFIVRSGSRYNTSIAEAGPGATYEWTIRGGRILSGQGTREIEWRCGGSAASIAVNVSVSRNGMVAECHKEWYLRRSL